MNGFGAIAGSLGPKGLNGLNGLNSPKGLKGLMKSTGAGGPAAAKDMAKAEKANAPKAQGKPPATDFGRDGALMRGKGFSQRDAFEPAQRGQKPGQPKLTDPGAPAQQSAQKQGIQPDDVLKQSAQKQSTQPQDAQKQSIQQQDIQQGQQADADKRAQQAAETRLTRMLQDAVLHMAMAIQKASEYDEEDLRKKLLEFLKWLKEMDAIFAPAPAS